MKVRNLIKSLEQAGQELDRIGGSYRHPKKPELGAVTVAGRLAEGWSEAMNKYAVVIERGETS